MLIFLQGKKVIILLELEVLQSGKDVGGKIDTPISINPDGTVPPGSGDENKRPTNNAFIVFRMPIFMWNSQPIGLQTKREKIKK